RRQPPQVQTACAAVDPGQLAVARAMPLRSFIYRHRLLAKRVIATAVRVLPESASRHLLALAERAAFSVTPQYQGDTLPPICHYWTGRYLADEARRLGFGSAEALYRDRIVQRSGETGKPVRVASAGCGAAGMEIELARGLKSDGIPVLITCFDFNPGLMRHAADMAQAADVADTMRFEVRDCNQPFALPEQDVIIVNQFFHHVTALETFCASLRQSLAPAGVLLSSDIIGRTAISCGPTWRWWWSNSGPRSGRRNGMTGTSVMFAKTTGRSTTPPIRTRECARRMSSPACLRHSTSSSSTASAVRSCPSSSAASASISTRPTRPIVPSSIPCSRPMQLPWPRSATLRRTWWPSCATGAGWSGPSMSRSARNAMWN